MKFDKTLLDTLTARAKESPRLRMNLDLRNTPEDLSQRMLNALEPGTVLPIHHHVKSSEAVVLLRGSIRQNFYNDAGETVESFVASAGGRAEGLLQVLPSRQVSGTTPNALSPEQSFWNVRTGPMSRLLRRIYFI